MDPARCRGRRGGPEVQTNWCDWFLLDGRFAKLVRAACSRRTIWFPLGPELHQILAPPHASDPKPTPNVTHMEVNPPLVRQTNFPYDTVDD